ncbi:spiro-SPASM protein [Spirochaeta cellobiosiphila]|uniref:spiro-SPASM protein n=1 Tax=Spirochaeta cellobiosiphila TaxID=504483 RepID=UPI000425E2D4|nr:spiro-SPASM protein [Spirochaeta cellobiosiphila]
MKILAVINNIGFNQQLIHQSFNKGDSSFDRVLSYIKDLEQVTGVETLEENIKTFDELLRKLMEISQGYDAILYCFSDSPFYDSNLTKEMLDNHFKYFAEYSFADGYPIGLSPEIISVSILPQLEKLAKKERSIERNSFFETLMIDINSFDIETKISGIDYRYLRLNLTCNNLQNFTVAERLAAATNEDHEKIINHLEEYQYLLRGLPSHYVFQIYQGNNQDPEYDIYYKKFPDHLKSQKHIAIDQWQTILEGIVGLTPKAVITLGLWGEPALHPHIYDIIRMTLGFPTIELVIETNGTSWDIDLLNELYKGGSIPRLKWILYLDSDVPSLYEKIRGCKLDAAIQFCDYMLTHNPNEFYIQVTRLQEYEEHLEPFFRRWREKTENIIIQKYNHYSHRLKERKVTDLSPLIRRVCWHVKRELYFMVDGSGLPCKDSFEGDFVLGNIFNDNLTNIWNKGDEYYQLQVNKKYPSLCKECDEYYTFNF